MMQAANERYLAFIAAIDNPNAGLKAIDKIARPVKDGGRSYRGFNLFLGDDLDGAEPAGLLHAVGDNIPRPTRPGDTPRFLRFAGVTLRVVIGRIL